MKKEYLQATQASYDTLACEYVKRIADELRHKPLDRKLLDDFAQMVKPLGPVCDLGCGPGHVARYLQGHGVSVFGIDLSPRMVAEARKLNPGMEFQQGDMLALTCEGESLGGVVAFYSLIHIPLDSIPQALLEIRRVLKPGGKLLLSFHIGTEVLHLDELWDLPVNVDFHFFESARIISELEQAGFAVENVIERAAYPEVEVQTRRAYISAQKPG